MARQVQIRRGTTAEHSTFTGAVGELTVDITKDVVVVHDGSTAGGVPMIKAADLAAGTGIDVTGTTITNTAPDQTVSLTGGTGISTSGTYPDFTITNDSPDQTVVLTDGTGITTSGTYPNFTITNSAPDQTVVLTEGSNVTITGTYPNFTIASTDTNTTYTAGSGLSLTGTEFANTAPDQTVVLTEGSNVTITGTYPNFTIASTDTNTTYTAGSGLSLTGTEFANTAPDQTVVLNSGTGISATGTYPNFTITNTAPDQTVSLTQGSNVTITGTYPNFTIASTDTNTTYSAGNGISLSGTTFSVAAGGGLTQDASGLSHSDTSSQGSVNNSGATVIQDVTLDTYGHVTGLASATLSASTVGAMASTNPVISSGTIVEDVYAISGTSVSLEPDNGSVQTHTLSGATTYTDGFSSGQAITLMIDDGSDSTITWPTMTWVNNGGAAPTLATSGYTVVSLWKVSTTLYGALVGDGS